MEALSPGHPLLLHLYIIFALSLLFIIKFLFPFWLKHFSVHHLETSWDWWSRSSFL